MAGTDGGGPAVHAPGGAALLSAEEHPPGSCSEYAEGRGGGSDRERGGRRCGVARTY